MAASQARLLSITARLSNNEMEQQSIAYSKQRLSDSSQQINDAYLDALSKTKYQVLTGYNNSEACYADLSYNQITGLNTVACGKQYLVRDKEGKVLVSSAVAKQFKETNGDFNRFLNGLGYTQADIDVKKYAESEEAIQEAWDKYLAAVGKNIYDMDGQHILDFDYTSFSDKSFDGYPTYDTAYTADENGNTINLFKDSNGYYKERYTVEAREITNDDGEIERVVGYWLNDDTFNKLIDVNYNAESEKFIYTNQEGETVEADALYADPNEDLISEDYKNYLTPTGGNNYTTEGGTTYQVTKQTKALNYEGTTAAQRELYDYAEALTEAYYNNSVSHSTTTLKYDAETVNYYKNIFNEMRARGYTTTENETNLKDSDWFVKQLKSGALTLAYYSTAEKAFMGTTLDDDESIAEREDTSAMNIAEQVYQNNMDKLQSQDKQFDLQLNKLESEHNALQTEYEAVNKVIKNNVEKSFNIFNA